MANVPQTFLAALPRQRDIESMAAGVDERGRFFLLKCRLRDASEEVLLIPPAVAFHVRDSARKTIDTLRYRDLRRRVGDKRPEVPEIRRYLDNQPDIVAPDWDGKDDQRVASGCEVRAFPDALFLCFRVGGQRNSTYKVLRLSPLLSFYLVDMISRAEREGAIQDISKATSPSDQKH